MDGARAESLLIAQTVYGAASGTGHGCGRAGSRLIAALHMAGPAAEHAAKLMLSGRFIGRPCDGDIVLLGDEEDPS